MTDKYVPKVGEECEVNHDGEWHKTYIVGVSKSGSYVYYCGNFDRRYPYDGQINLDNFRPIKSPEEQERDRLIGELSSDARIHWDSAEVAIDKGWHKGPKVKAISWNEFQKICTDCKGNYSCLYSTLYGEGYIVEDKE